MALYVSKEYYKEIFKGSMPDEEIEKNLRLAQNKIDRITLNRIVGIGFDNLTEFQKEKIRESICYQADYIRENGYNNEDNSDISSYSVLDISVTVQAKDSASKTKAELECMSELAYDSIVQTGLTSRNWRYNG